MQLKKFIQSVTTEFNKEFTNERRLRAAEAIAENYRINPPQIVLLFTQPELYTLPLEDRCARAGVTEEELFLCSIQPGFQRFLQDFEGIARTTVTMQSLEKIGRSISTARIIPSKYGDREDFSIEMKAIEKPAVQVNNTTNTQNNFYEQARARLLEARPDDE